MNTPGPIQQPVTSAWSMYRAVVGIGTLCAVLIVSVYQSTSARIRDNRDRFLARAVAEVLPEARSTVAVALTEDGGLAAMAEAAALPVFLGFDADDELVGAVVTAEDMGYQDNIRLLYAYSFEHRAIVGFKVLESKETPGLGDRVEKEPVVTVKQGEKAEPWQIDGITGATITSEAVGTIVNDSAGAWLPVLEAHARSISPPQVTPVVTEAN
jgi:electron transport complex protein RnfG